MCLFKKRYFPETLREIGSEGLGKITKKQYVGINDDYKYIDIRRCRDFTSFFDCENKRFLFLVDGNWITEDDIFGEKRIHNGKTKNILD